MNYRIIFTSLLLLNLAACNKKSDNLAEEKTTQLTYSFKEENNGIKCETGSKVFSSEETYCEALRNNSENNNCAIEMRKITFDSKCKGTFGPVAEKPAPPPETPQRRLAPPVPLPTSKDIEKIEIKAVGKINHNVNNTGKNLVTLVTASIPIEFIQPAEKLNFIVGTGFKILNSGAANCKFDGASDIAIKNNEVKITLISIVELPLKSEKKDDECVFSLARLVDGFDIQLNDVSSLDALGNEKKIKQIDLKIIKGQ